MTPKRNALISLEAGTTNDFLCIEAKTLVPFAEAKTLVREFPQKADC